MRSLLNNLAKHGIAIDGSEVWIECPSDLIDIARPNVLIDDPVT